MEERMARIYKDKKGTLGIKDDDVFIAMFTEKAKDFDEESMMEVGAIDTSVSVFRPHQVPGALIAWYPNDGDLEFYFLGWTSRTKLMTYVPIRKNLLMGYYASKTEGAASVYFFVKCGEINGVSVYSYSSDMVVREDTTEWVSSNNGSFVVPHIPKTFHD